MPYFVLSVILVVGVLAYMFGEHMARIGVALIMALFSCAVLSLVYITVWDINRQIYAKPQAAVRYGGSR